MPGVPTRCVRGTQGFMKGWNQLQGFYLVQCRRSCSCSKERVQSINSQWKYQFWGDECSYQPVESKTHRIFWRVWEIPFIGGSFIAARTPLIYWCFFFLVPFFAACDRMVVSVSWSFVTLGNPSNPIETLSLRGHMTCCTLSELYGHTLLTAVSTTNMFLYFQYETTPDSSSSVNSKLINELMYCCIASDHLFIPNAFSS